MEKKNYKNNSRTWEAVRQLTLPAMAVVVALIVLWYAYITTTNPTISCVHLVLTGQGGGQLQGNGLFPNSIIDANQSTLSQWYCNHFNNLSEYNICPTTANCTNRTITKSHLISILQAERRTINDSTQSINTTTTQP